VTISVNGQPFVVPAGTTVAAAMLRAGGTTRTSVSGEMRAPLCGMGICFECRAVIGGKPHERTCQIVCEPGMDVWST
jgi:sarcosine oxidase subunit alpha